MILRQYSRCYLISIRIIALIAIVYMAGFFLEKNFGRGGQTNVSRNRGGGGHKLELKYIMYFVASASSAYSSCLILHSVCAN